MSERPACRAPAKWISAAWSACTRCSSRRETPSALLDWNNNYGDDPDKAVCFHCSNLPKHFFEERHDGLPGDHRRHGRASENTFGTCVGQVKASPMSFARSPPTIATGKIRGYVGEGEFTDDPLRPSAAPAWSRSRSCRTCCATSARTASSITWRPTCRTVADAVHEATTTYLGWDVHTRAASQACAVAAVRVRVHEHRRRRRFRHAQRSRLDLRQRARAGSGAGTAEYPLHRKQGRSGPRHAEPRRPHERAGRGHAQARSTDAGVDGTAIEAIALDTTGSSVIPVDAQLEPLDDYYLWCDHRAWDEAAEITAAAHAAQPRSHRLVRRHLLVASGASPSCCTGCATIPRSATAWPPRSSIATWWPPSCAASPIRRRSRAASAPWATSGCGTSRSAGCPPEEFLTAVDPLLAGVREQARRALRHHRPDRRAPLARSGPSGSACAPAFPIPVGAFDAHWDAIGAGVPHRRRRQRGRHLHLHHGDQRRVRR